MTPIDKTKPYIPLSGGATDGWSSDDHATATCYCGAVQLSFPTTPPGLYSTFICHCTDCRKITATMFASSFIILDSHLTHIRGKGNLTVFEQTKSIESGRAMTSYFCKTCGTLMYRGSAAHPVKSLRLGTVDDFHLHETKLKPTREIWVKDRVEWLDPIDMSARALVRIKLKSLLRKRQALIRSVYNVRSPAIHPKA